MPQDEIIRKKPLAPKIEEIFWMRFLHPENTHTQTDRHTHTVIKTK